MLRGERGAALISARLAAVKWNSNAVLWGTVLVMVAFLLVWAVAYWWANSRSSGTENAPASQTTGALGRSLSRHGSSYAGEFSPRPDTHTGRVKDKYSWTDDDEWQTDFGLLSTNYSKEKFAARHEGLVMKQGGGHGRAEKLLHYDVDQVTSWSALYYLSGTAVGASQIWVTCAGYWILAVAVVFAARAIPFGEYHVNVHEGMERLTSLTNFLAALIGFMLGLFVSILIARWWNCRIDCLENLFAALSDVQLFLAVRLDHSKEDVAVKETCLRYSLLVHRLVYYEIRSLDEDEYLRYMEHVGLLEADETPLLRDRPAKASTVIVWIGKLYTSLGLARAWQPVDMLHLDEQLSRARNAIGQVSAYTDTQLPFQYVHLLSFVVISCNLILVLDVGLSLGTSLKPGSSPDPVFVALEIFRVLVQPLAYHAFLRLGSELSNPFGFDFNDFPMYAHHCMLRREGLAISKAGEQLPEALGAK
jgi:predicted membrane chloride channel (bestrophin family)